MSGAVLQRCVIFADVAGSTRLYEMLGDSSALRAIEACLKRVAKAAAVYDGTLVKTIGDEAMLVFDSAERGVLAACEMQQALDALPPNGAKLAIRVGCHSGSVILEGGDYFGDTVNVAARLGEIAKAGQIICSETTLAGIPQLLQPRTRRVEAVTVKGKSEPLSVVEVLWRAEEELTLMSERDLPKAASLRRLRLRHGSAEGFVDVLRPLVTLGREKDNTFVISDGRASRSHARLELRQGSFILTDQSSNGTYVNGAGQESYLVRREETILNGSGRLTFGQAWRDGIESLEFEILG